jgi:hypothetical protein
MAQTKKQEEAVGQDWLARPSPEATAFETESKVLEYGEAFTRVLAGGGGPSAMRARLAALRLVVPLLLAFLFSGCGVEVQNVEADVAAEIEQLFDSGVHEHEYRFLCRTHFEQTLPDGSTEVLGCITNQRCIEEAERSGMAAQLRADGNTLGCPEVKS